MSISASKIAVDSAYTAVPFWRYIRTDIQWWRGFQGRLRGCFEAAAGRRRRTSIQIIKVYPGHRPRTLTKRNFHYVNTETVPGKSLSTDVKKSAKQLVDKEAKAAASEFIDALH